MHLFEGLTPAGRLLLVYRAAVRDKGILLRWMGEGDRFLPYLARKKSLPAWFKQEFDISDIRPGYAQDLAAGAYLLLEGLFGSNVRHAKIRNSYEPLYYNAGILKWLEPAFDGRGPGSLRAQALFAALRGMYVFTLDHYIKHQERFYENGALQVALAAFAGSGMVEDALAAEIGERFTGGKARLASLPQRWNEFAEQAGVAAAFRDYAEQLRKEAGA